MQDERRPPGRGERLQDDEQRQPTESASTASSAGSGSAAATIGSGTWVSSDSAVAACPNSPYFTGAERATLTLTGAVTRIADRQDSVSDEIWAEAARHYDEQGLSALPISISAANAWNRLNVTTRQVVGQWAEAQ